MSEEDTATPTTGVQPGNRYNIAVMIIVPAFVLIAFMLFMQLTMSNTTFDSINDIISKNMTQQQTKDAVRAFEDINKSNQTVFYTILPILSALVGAVVAFYFGDKNLQAAHDIFGKTQKSFEKTQATLVKALSKEEKLVKITIEKLMENQPLTKDVKTTTMDERLDKAYEKLKDIPNLVIVDDKKKPLGIIYRWELTVPPGETSYKKDMKIKDWISEKTRLDYILKTKWTTKGIENYASLMPDHTLKKAKELMDKVKTDRDLSVRGLVFDEEEKIIGIINNDNISKELIDT